MFRPLGLLAVLIVAPFPFAARAADQADSIYHGGEIVTVNEKSPSAEAVAVKGGKIVAVGTKADVTNKWQGDATRLIDLGGKTMAPGFIDPHSHLSFGMAMKNQANVSAPPVGPAKNPGEIVAELQTFAQNKGIKPGELVVGYGYDNTLMPDGKLLTRDDIDPVISDKPVVVIHVSGHGGVLNSAALTKYNITEDMQSPAGGVIGRDPVTGKLTGLLMETAWLPVQHQLPSPTTPQEETEQLIFAQNLYAAAGVTTAQDGAPHAPDVARMKRGADRGDLFIDVVSYPFILDLKEVLKTHPVSSFGKYDKHFKLGGAKIVSDGSPQGLTAFFTTPYQHGSPDDPNNSDWKGEPTFKQAELNVAYMYCYERGLQVLSHANGDAAIDMNLKAHEHAAAGSLNKDRRTVLIHSQFVRRDQLKKYVKYHLIPSFYTEHTFFFGDAHIKNRGKEQASFISPMKTAIVKGLQPTNHTDFNVVPIDQMMVLWSAVNRKTRSGDVLGPDERVSPMDALKAITINAARQYFEEETKGSLEPGKLADLVILSANPLRVDPDMIKEIEVLETIKEGKTIYRQ